MSSFAASAGRATVSVVRAPTVWMWYRPLWKNLYRSGLSQVTMGKDFSFTVSPMALFNVARSMMGRSALLPKVLA